MAREISDVGLGRRSHVGHERRRSRTDGAKGIRDRQVPGRRRRDGRTDTRKRFPAKRGDASRVDVVLCRKWPRRERYGRSSLQRPALVV